VGTLCKLCVLSSCNTWVCFTLLHFEFVAFQVVSFALQPKVMHFAFSQKIMNFSLLHFELLVSHCCILNLDLFYYWCLFSTCLWWQLQIFSKVNHHILSFWSILHFFVELFMIIVCVFLCVTIVLDLQKLWTISYF
jgi:hypothetical protein